MILILDTTTKEILYTMNDNDWEFLIYPKIQNDLEVLIPKQLSVLNFNSWNHPKYKKRV